MRPYAFLAVASLIASSVAVCSQPYSFSTIAGQAGSGGTADGTNSAARFTALAGAAVDVAGTAVYVADGNALRRLVRVGTNWVVSTLAGSIGTHGFADGTNAAALFNYPQGVAVDTAGNLYVADTGNHAIRKVSPVGTNWVVTTIAGPAPPIPAFGTSDGTNHDARFHQPYGIAVDTAGVVYVADTLNHTIRLVAPSGTNWIVTTLAGWPTTSGNLDGTGTNAEFVSPAGITASSGGPLYVSDFGGNTIRKITPPGAGWVVTTLAGQGGSAGATDGLGSAARFNQPLGIAVDGTGHVLVADSGNDTIRRITPAGNVSTIAGLAGFTGDADGIGSAARFNTPQGLGADGAGNVYVNDYLNYTIRQGVVAALLQIKKVNDQVVLSWPVEFSGFTAQVSSSLSSPSWNSILKSPSVEGDYWVLTNAVQSSPGFYRLIK
jgi:hypothetical protein